MRRDKRGGCELTQRDGDARRWQPTISVSTPTSGATYTQGVSVVANYSCADAVAGIVTCSGAVANGAPIDTNSVGSSTFSVTAIGCRGQYDDGGRYLSDHRVRGRIDEHKRR